MFKYIKIENGSIKLDPYLEYVENTVWDKKSGLDLLQVSSRIDPFSRDSFREGYIKSFNVTPSGDYSGDVDIVIEIENAYRDKQFTLKYRDVSDIEFPKMGYAIACSLSLQELIILDDKSYKHEFSFLHDWRLIIVAKNVEFSQKDLTN